MLGSVHYLSQGGGVAIFSRHDIETFLTPPSDLIKTFLTPPPGHMETFLTPPLPIVQHVKFHFPIVILVLKFHLQTT